MIGHNDTTEKMTDISTKILRRQTVSQPGADPSKSGAPALRCTQAVDTAATTRDDPNGNDIPSVNLTRVTEEHDTDEIDALPTRMEYTVKDVVIVLMSIMTFLVDTGTDIWVAVYFYRQQRLWEFVLTLTFVVVPALTMTGFSLRWYLNDADSLDAGDGVTRIKKPHVPMWKWIVRVVCLVFQLGPLLRYVEAMFYGIKSMRAQHAQNREEHVKNYIYMIYKDADATLLRLFESFMEAAPQLVLQLYILVSEHNRHLRPPPSPLGGHMMDDAPHSAPSALSVSMQVIAICTSLFSLAWSLCNYQRSLRYSLPAKSNLTVLGTATLFLWHLCSVAARVLAISLCASVYPVYVACGCLGHWVLMTVWLIYQQTDACYSRCEEFLFDIVLGAVYIFTFFNVKDQPTRYKYVFFYTVCGVENTVMLVSWSLRANPRLWWHWPGVVAQPTLFCLAVSLMLLYYRCHHPSLAAGRGVGGTSGPSICPTGQVCRNVDLVRAYGLSLEEWATDVSTTRSHNTSSAETQLITAPQSTSSIKNAALSSQCNSQVSGN